MPISFHASACAFIFHLRHEMPRSPARYARGSAARREVRHMIAQRESAFTFFFSAFSSSSACHTAAAAFRRLCFSFIVS
jgi:hypothetical protein